MSISVDVGSISSDKIVVNEIVIDGAELCWEGLSGENHKKILANIQEYTEASETAETEAIEEEVATEGAPAGKQKSLEIKEFRMTNTKVYLYGFGKKLAEVSLPDFKQTGIGSNGSVEMSEAVGILYSSVLGSVGQLIEDSKGMIGDSWGKLSEMGSGTVDSIKEESKSLVDGVKGLFK